MKFIHITPEQFAELLNERVQFEYYDGDYFYVRATLDDPESAIPFELHISLYEVKKGHGILFNNDRLKELLEGRFNIVDVYIITKSEKVAITNYAL